jgi:putative peptidoglycan lipid II flippase
LLFQRGAFGAADTIVVGRVQAFLALQIPFYLLSAMGVRVLSALKRNSLIMWVSGVSTTLNIILNWILMKYAGVAGIALSTSLVYLVSCSLIFASLALLLKRA